MLGFIFIIRVYENLEMPLFEETVLMLMGVSSGMYAALKLGENRTLTNTAVAVNNTASLSSLSTATNDESETVIDEATIAEKETAG
ncbi:hypothetical protein GXP67_14445 [Rhodocytophaga rosea]|uniref:Uncharacterized protein n=1 Tax=Rhodocytophaga rosea TaxID=2704465 RepID=A0A6C0GI89_9BACT|nr:hypothetical protein [Rhodocytophaga rosea]QHT67746.1 hypothetical protein GXP67_14445 [Rhodocytophaga rosea]